LYQLRSALLAVGRGGQRGDAEDARTHAFGDRLDRATFAGAVTAFEHDADLEPLVLHPLLELDQLDVQTLELFIVFLGFELPVRAVAVPVPDHGVLVVFLDFDFHDGRVSRSDG
jgi:hypothetical protein